MSVLFWRWFNCALQTSWAIGWSPEGGFRRRGRNFDPAFRRMPTKSSRWVYDLFVRCTTREPFKGYLAIGEFKGNLYKLITLSACPPSATRNFSLFDSWNFKVKSSLPPESAVPHLTFVYKFIDCRIFVYTSFINSFFVDENKANKALINDIN